MWRNSTHCNKIGSLPLPALPLCCCTLCATWYILPLPPHLHKLLLLPRMRHIAPGGVRARLHKGTVGEHSRHSHIVHTALLSRTQDEHPHKDTPTHQNTQHMQAQQALQHSHG